MRLANLTTARIKNFTGLAGALFIYSISFAQENSPYSRYGVGDLIPNQNMVNRAMGGISAGISEFGSINFSNPASLASIDRTIFDIGGEIARRTLKSNNSPLKYTATNTLISYLQVGVPLSSPKMLAKNKSWGLSFGLRPLSRINYKIEDNSIVVGDSLNTLYEGSGGLSQANISTAVRLKNLSIGISGGYTFGNKDYSTRKTFINDSTIFYRSNTATQSNFGGGFLNIGLQYGWWGPGKGEGANQKRARYTIGGTVNLTQKLRLKQDNLSETFADDGNGGTVSIDTVSFVSGVKGKMEIPMMYSFGFSRSTESWVYGVDVNIANWENYKYLGTKDASLQNSWMVRAGFQYYPAPTNTRSNRYWTAAKYRGGIYYGNDYINIGKDRPEYGITAGLGLPLTTAQRLNSIDGDYVTLNLGTEVGVRGNKNSTSLRENIFRLNVGVSMNARWFTKRKYY